MLESVCYNHLHRKEAIAMDSPDYTTEHQKGKHLTYEDYVKIQVRLQDGWSANRIAVKELHCSLNTV